MNGHSFGSEYMRTALLVTLILAGNLIVFAQTDMPKPTYDFSLSREGKIKRSSLPRVLRRLRSQVKLRCIC